MAFMTPAPSPTIALYMARLFLVRTFAILVALVLILQMLDLLGESGDILAYPGNGNAELWRYVGHRVPQLVARFLPFSVLLGTLVTLVTLNQNSEIVILKASGISAQQILAPLMIASFAIAAISFVFNERVLVRSNAALAAWQAVDYGPVRTGSGLTHDVWVRDGDDLINAGTVDQRAQVNGKTGIRLSDVRVYDRQQGRLVRILSAREAVPAGNGWRLSEVRIFNVASGRTTTRPELIAGEGINPDRFTLSAVDANGLDLPSLAKAISDLDAAGRPTDPLRAALWHKISGPLSSVLMPLLAAVAAFGLARSGKLFVRSVIGMGLGFAYFVADNFMLAMGNFGAVPPFLAAWSPFLLFFLIGEAVLLRTEE
jgi:lipopolysaccharide export system permease protein